VRLPQALPLLLVVVAILAAGCGVDFSSAKQGNEFFKSLAVTGDLRAGSPLTAAVTYEQNNPVAVVIKCEVRQGKDLVKEIGGESAPLLAGGGPEATPFPGNFSFDFSMEQPGTYKAECFTPADEDNYIIKTFTIGPAATPTPATGG